MSEDNKEMLSFFSTIFGVKPDQDATAVDPKKNKKKKEDGEDDVSYHLSRYVPKLKKILEVFFYFFFFFFFYLVFFFLF